MESKYIGKVEELETLADQDCYCDTEEPWERCRSCKAGSTLNEIKFKINETYRELIEKFI